MKAKVKKPTVIKRHFISAENKSESKSESKKLKLKFVYYFLASGRMSANALMRARMKARRERQLQKAEEAAVEKVGSLLTWNRSSREKCFLINAKFPIRFISIASSCQTTSLAWHVSRKEYQPFLSG